MPRYKQNINETLFEEDAYRLFKIADTETKKIMICLAWITGARPSELREIKFENILYTKEYITIRVNTKKLGKGDFKVDYRNLTLIRNSTTEESLYIEFLIDYIKRYNGSKEDFVLPMAESTMRKYINKISKEAIGKEITMYHLRHSVMTHLASTGKIGIRELMTWKGTSSMNSVATYLNARPFVLNMKGISRSKHADLSATMDSKNNIEENSVVIFQQPASQTEQPPLEQPKEPVEAIPINDKPLEKPKEEKKEEQKEEKAIQPSGHAESTS